MTIERIVPPAPAPERRLPWTIVGSAAAHAALLALAVSAGGYVLPPAHSYVEIPVEFLIDPETDPAPPEPEPLSGAKQPDGAASETASLAEARLPDPAPPEPGPIPETGPADPAPLELAARSETSPPEPSRSPAAAAAPSDPPHEAADAEPADLPREAAVEEELAVAPPEAAVEAGPADTPRESAMDLKPVDPPDRSLEPAIEAQRADPPPQPASAPPEDRPARAVLPEADAAPNSKETEIATGNLPATAEAPAEKPVPVAADDPRPASAVSGSPEGDPAAPAPPEPPPGPAVVATDGQPPGAAAVASLPPLAPVPTVLEDALEPPPISPAETPKQPIALPVPQDEAPEPPITPPAPAGDAQTAERAEAAPAGEPVQPAAQEPGGVAATALAAQDSPTPAPIADAPAAPSPLPPAAPLEAAVPLDPPAPAFLATPPEPAATAVPHDLADRLQASAALPSQDQGAISGLVGQDPPAGETPPIPPERPAAPADPVAAETPVLPPPERPAAPADPVATASLPAASERAPSSPLGAAGPVLRETAATSASGAARSEGPFSAPARSGPPVVQASDYLVGVVPTAGAGGKGEAVALGASSFGRPMTARELKQLYEGHTWLWTGGGGYFGKGGGFTAVAGREPETASQAQGRWETSDSGRMCFGGLRRTRSGREPFRTCFLHFAWGEAIYHRREPDGRWIAFRRSPPRETDEVHKLVKGNRIGEQLREVRAALGPAR
ncbi:MAG TPA: DUF995 domain-containing protein [Microvirga sp.]|jgi:hypothetical protein|nr:DUF995 domain-containing protein [Microvirga sp.]